MKMKATCLFWTIIGIGIMGMVLLAVPPAVGLVLDIIADARTTDFLILMAIVLVAWGVRYEYEYFAHKKSNTLLLSGVVLVTISIILILACLFQDTFLDMSIAYANFKKSYAEEFMLVKIIGCFLIVLAIGMMTSLLILRVNKHNNHKVKENTEEEDLDEEEKELDEQYQRVMSPYYSRFLDGDENIDDQ